MEKLILLDAGHGGIINGQYVTAPKKMVVFPDGFTIYEGVWNRIVVEGIKEALTSAGVKFDDIVNSQKDIPLKNRVDRANRLAAEAGPKNALFVSVHANAGGGNGYEVYTSKGESASDKAATNYMDFMAEAFPSHRGRKDTTDGDSDKEANFYVLKYTICPAILTESFFMDNYQEAKEMTTPEAIKKVVQAHLRTIYAFCHA